MKLSEAVFVNPAALLTSRGIKNEKTYFPYVDTVVSVIVRLWRKKHKKQVVSKGGCNITMEKGIIYSLHILL